MPSLRQLANFPASMRIPARLLAITPALFLTACGALGGGGDSDLPASKMATESNSPDPVAEFRMKSGEPGDNDEGKILDRFSARNTSMNPDGSTTGTDKGRKEFAGFKRDNPEFKGKWDNKEYKAGDFRKKSWWGDKDYATKVYAGNTDASSLKKDSRFGGKSANESAVAARESSENYGTKDYRTGRANEEGGDRIGKVSDAETNIRRRVFTKPQVIPWQLQNLTVEDTNRMMGRDR